MHDTINDRLSEYVDDELTAEERPIFDAHLSSCAACRADVEDLRRVAARAASLRDAAPEANLWPGVVDRIGEADAPRVRATRRFSFTLPQLVAAGLALMLLSGGMVWLARLGGPGTDFPPIGAVDPDRIPVNFADGAYDQAIEDLQRTLEAGRPRLDKETLRVLDENLLILDRAIVEAREALAHDPDNVYLKAHLASTRARRLALLRHAATILDRAS